MFLNNKLSLRIKLLLLIVSIFILIFNFKNSVINGHFFINIHIAVIGLFFLFYYQFIRTRLIYIVITITSVSFSILLFDFTNLLFNFTAKKYLYPANVTVIEKQDFLIDEQITFSKSIPSGYLYKDGAYNSKKSYLKDEAEFLIYDVKYNIVNGLRTNPLKSKNSICSEVIFLGGSHNYGWGLDFEDTLQGMFEEDRFTTLNLSLPGFGLSNSFALLIDHIDQAECKKDDKKKYFVYRMIDDHINRNVGKTSLNLYGPNFFSREMEDNLYNSNCNDLIDCAYYLLRYGLTRFTYYLLASNYEASSRIIGKYLDKSWRYQENDFQKSIELIESYINFTRKYYENTEHIIIIDEGNTKESEKIFNLLKEIRNINVLKIDEDRIFFLGDNNFNQYKTSEISNNICSNDKSLKLKYDYHPTECSNLIIYSFISKYFLS